MRVISLACTFLLLGAGVCVGAMKDLRGDHCIVSYEVDESHAREVLHQAERLYASIMRNLGHDQIAQPWLGDRRCKITIYKDQEEFMARTKGIEWAEGMANYTTREIFAFHDTPNLLSNVLPHEMAHLMFREIVGTTRAIPLWLDEGVALSQEPNRSDQFYPIASKAIEDKTFIAFEDMMKISDAKELSTQRAAIFYAEALATVNFLLETYHKEKFLKFCRLLREGKIVPEALLAMYGTDRIRSLKDLQDQVQKFLDKNLSAYN